MSHHPHDSPSSTDLGDSPTSDSPHGRQDGARPSLAVGQIVDDFEPARVLGHGAFGTVYLARQISLDRWVALKVTPNRGSEARALAHLEHDNIVRVFSETVLAERGLRLLCMQFVPGSALDRLIRDQDWTRPDAGSGPSLLTALDRVSNAPVEFDPTALADRERLAECDFAEAACWLGARLAGALAFAHGRSVLHHDIKPANILVNRYGRPMLVDFNLALDPHKPRDPKRDSFGGTPNYMAPEHLDAMNPCEDTTPADVDARADIYSLGLVLFELLTGRPAFDPKRLGDDFIDNLTLKAAERRESPPTPSAVRRQVPSDLDRTVRRCLRPTPRERFPTAEELASALDGCGFLRRAHRRMPPAGPVSKVIARWPLMTTLALAFLPHLLGSAVNIAYNQARIISALSPEQQAEFKELVMGYNLIVYPLCVLLAAIRITPVVRVWRRLRHGELVDRETVARARRLVLTWPGWVLGLSILGWFPGALLFPAVLHYRSGPLSNEVFDHLVLSFLVSGLIALTYSVSLVQYAAVRVLYPSLWSDGFAAERTAADELAGQNRLVAWMPFLAGLIPLIGAILMVGVGPDAQFTRAYRLLVTSLIALGIFGFGASLFLASRLRGVLIALGGAKKNGTVAELGAFGRR